MTDDLDRLVAYHCAPTLMGMKAGNMFSLKRSAFIGREEKVQAILHMLREKGLSAKVFHTPWDASLIYLYRIDLLKENLSHPLSRSLLHSLHYQGQDTEELVEQLGCRMEKNESFPHEIGLFLGYPPEDVAGFVKHKGARCKFCVLEGIWRRGKGQSVFRAICLLPLCLFAGFEKRHDTQPGCPRNIKQGR